jgi:hypothetical protein
VIGCSLHASVAVPARDRSYLERGFQQTRRLTWAELRRRVLAVDPESDLEPERGGDPRPDLEALSGRLATDDRNGDRPIAAANPCPIQRCVRAEIRCE